MNRSKLEKEEQLAAQAHSVQEQTTKEFSSPEEMLRYDAAQVEVSAELLPRLRATVASEGLTPKPSPWWRRLWGRPGQA